jgi:precorrin-6B methylase 2
MFCTFKLPVTLALCLVSWSASGTTAAEPAKSAEPKRGPDVVFVPTPDDIVTKMLQMAGVTKDDVLYDPGCGDGRIVVTAAKKFGCRGVGIDISAQRVQEAQANARRNNVDQLVKIVEQDIFEADLSEATVVALYLLPSMNVKLIPQLQKLKPGSRIVAHDYGFEGRVKPDKSITVTSKEDAVEHHIMFWKTPLKVEPIAGADPAAKDAAEEEKQ